MTRKIAIDWDETEIRLVAAQVSGNSVKVSEAALIAVEDGNVMETLRKAIALRGLERTETLVAIGRGKAELRELQLPPVPADELPDMVRFQAIRSFATAGDSATVDYLVTGQDDSGTSMIAAAVGPAKLSEIHEICEASDLQTKRIALRPLAAAALYLSNNKHPATLGETVLIDLLSDDAEIVVARNGKVIFVRTVRLPSVAAGRPAALAGELRRSLLACGATGSPDRVVLWGLESVHKADVNEVAEASGCSVDVINPFDLVDISRSAMDSLPKHVGRLAPLVGLLASDELGGERLIDFLNPRKRAEEKSHTLRNSLLIGVPVVAALVLAFLGYRQVSGLDREIDELTKANAAMEEPVKLASVSRERTERVDVFLDGDVNWLDEIRRLAQVMPPAQDMIVRSISGTIDPRSGGGTLQVAGGVVDPSMIDDLEESLRDEDHRVVGDGAKEGKQGDTYRWGYNEKITISPSTVRQLRYQALTSTPAHRPSRHRLTKMSSRSLNSGHQTPSHLRPPKSPLPRSSRQLQPKSPPTQPKSQPTAEESTAEEPPPSVIQRRLNQLPRSRTQQSLQQPSQRRPMSPNRRPLTLNSQTATKPMRRSKVRPRPSLPT